MAAISLAASLAPCAPVYCDGVKVLRYVHCCCAGVLSMILHCYALCSLTAAYSHRTAFCSFHVHYAMLCCLQLVTVCFNQYDLDR
jgi:hypothetical protein